jgi:hypothetical protein
MALSSAGELLVASRFASTILEFNGATGAYDGILANTAPDYDPFRLAIIVTPEPGGVWLLAAGWRCSRL